MHFTLIFSRYVDYRICDFVICNTVCSIFVQQKFARVCQRKIGKRTSETNSKVASTHSSQVEIHLACYYSHPSRIAFQNQSIAVWFCVLISFYLFVKKKKRKKREEAVLFLSRMSYTSPRMDGSIGVPFAKMRIRRLGNQIHSAIYITLCEHNTYLINRIMKSQRTEGKPRSRKKRQSRRNGAKRKKIEKREWWHTHTHELI